MLSASLEAEAFGPADPAHQHKLQEQRIAYPSHNPFERRGEVCSPNFEMVLAYQWAQL